MQCAVRRWGKQKTFLLHSGTPAGPEERERWREEWGGGGKGERREQMGRKNLTR